MIFTSDGLAHPRPWLRDVVQFTLDEFSNDRLSMPRAAAAMTVVYQYHERFFHHLRRTGKAPTASIEGFRAHLGRASPSFGILAQAADSQPGHALTVDVLGAGATVQRAIVVAGAKRELIPLLEDVVAAYRHILDAHGL